MRLNKPINIATILTMLVLGLGIQTKASDMEDYVNSKIKEEFIKVEGEQLRAAMELPIPEDNLQVVPEWPRPMGHKDPQIQRLQPTTLGEQAATGDLPRAGISQKIDPTDPLEQRVIEKQAYDLYRENYRHAVQKEFLRRLHNAGWESTRNIAEEIKRKEEGLPDRD